ncbi:MAG: molybdenum cofactor guanylyltransferase [Bacteroidota bacterium]
MSDRLLNNDVCGVILSGGKSSRMGTNKALLKIDDQTIIERVFYLMKDVFDEVVISTNEPELYGFIDTEKVVDKFPGFGPLAGIHSALSTAQAKKIFITTCDLPFINSSLIKFLLNVKTEEMIVVPKAEDRIQFLCGIYDRKILPLLENILLNVLEAKNKNQEVKNSALSLWNFAERVGVEIVDVEEKIFYMMDLFFNINSPEDYEYVKERLI